MGDVIVYCTFCHKSQHDVVKIIDGGGAWICNECVDLCNEILEEEKGSKLVEMEDSEDFTPPKCIVPSKLFSLLSEYIVGQEEAKKVVSVAVYKHLKNASAPRDDFKGKDNVLLIGPTGTGKTLIAKILSLILEIPIVIGDATSLTENGYVGDDAESLLMYLIQAAGGSIKRAEHGLVFIDEIDKIARKSANISITRDVSGEGVQQALLAMMSGKVLQIDPVNKRKNPSAKFVDFNTDNVLFICAGVFEGIEDIVAKRLSKKETANQFNAIANRNSVKPDDFRQQISSADLIDYGFMPEFVARFNSIAVLTSLDAEAFIQIMSQSKAGTIKEYQQFFEDEGVQLKIQEDAVRLIADLAVKSSLGTRGLRSLLDRCLRDTMFALPGRGDIAECVIDRGAVEGLNQPQITSKSGDYIKLIRNKVFISYSHSDSYALEDLRTMLSPLIRNNTIEAWYDSLIKPSQKWRDEIDSAMAASKVAVLLVSPHFLASDFVMQNELPYFLNAAAREDVSILWVLLSSCLYTETDLKNYQASHDISKPLDFLTPAEQRAVWLRVAQNIKSLL